MKNLFLIAALFLALASCKKETPESPEPLPDGWLIQVSGCDQISFVQEAWPHSSGIAEGQLYQHIPFAGPNDVISVDARSNLDITSDDSTLHIEMDLDAVIRIYKIEGGVKTLVKEAKAFQQEFPEANPDESFFAFLYEEYCCDFDYFEQRICFISYEPLEVPRAEQMLFCKTKR